MPIIQAALKFTQGSTTDLAGRAVFGVTGASVVVSNGFSAGILIYKYEMLAVPAGSAVPTGIVSNSPSPTASFTPDVAGGYRVRLTVSDSKNFQVVDTRVFGIRNAQNRFHPPFGALGSELNFAGQTNGWDPYIGDYLNAVDEGPASFTLAASSAAIVAGDVVCIDQTDATGRTIRKGILADLYAAGGALGVSKGSFAPGASGVLVTVAGGQTSASVGDLSTSSRGDWVTVGPTARAVRSKAFSGGPVLGWCDQNGVLTVAPRATGSKTPLNVWNVLDFGAVPDAEVTFGTAASNPTIVAATDNLAAFQACFNAIQASGAPGEIYVPRGIYYLSATLELSGLYPVAISGEKGHRFAFGGGAPTSLVFPAYNALTGGTFVKGAAISVDTTAGTKIRDMVIWATPSGFAYRHWTTGLGASVNLFVIPSTGAIGFVFHPTNTPGTIALSNDEPVWGVKYDTGRRYSVGQFFWSEITDPLNPTHAVWQYTFTGASGDQKTADDQNPFVAYAGPCKIAGNGVAFSSADVGTSVRPADGVFNSSNGSLYTVVSVAAPVNLSADPNWASAATGSLQVTQNGVLFQRSQPCLPRTVGLVTKLITATGELDVTLTSTSGIFVDPNSANGGAGTVNWEVRPVCHGVMTTSSTHIENVSIQGALGDGIFVNAGQGSPSDLWIVRDSIIAHSARHGINIQGGDANIGEFSGNQVLGHGDTGILDNSFLGCTFEKGQLADEQNGHPGNFSIRVMQTTNGSTYNDVYIEGGYAPAWFRGATIFGRKGIWNFFPDSGFVGGFSCDDSGNRHTPRSFSAGPKGQPWATTRSNGSRKTFLNDFILPSAGSSFTIQATTVSYPGARKAPVTEPVWPTTTGSTVTETSTLVTNATAVTGNGVSPIVVTYGAAVDYDTGDQITNAGFGGNTNANGTFTITKVGPRSIALNGTTGNANWTSGGTTTRTDSITYTIGTTGHTVVTIGADADPMQAIDVLFSDCPGGSGNLTSFGLRANTPVSGEIGWTFGKNPGNSPISFNIVGGIPYTRLLYKVLINDQVLGTGGTGLDAVTPKPDDSCVRFSWTVASATAVTIDTYTPPDGAVVDVVWEFVVKQTVGTGNPKGARFRATVSVRRAGSVLTTLDAATVVAGTANEIAPTVTVDLTAAPVINLKFNSADAAKTFVIGGLREILGLPTA